MTIATATAKEQSAHDSLKAIGTLTAVKGIQVTPRANGVVSQILFHSGDQVKKGQLLVQLDDRAAKQELKSDLATLANAQLTYEQNNKLFKLGTVDKSTLSSSIKQLQIAKANVATAKVNLQYLKILAPFNGKLGIRQVNLGQVKEYTCVTLQQLSPIYVDFSLPSRYYPMLDVNQKVKLSVDAYPNKIFTGKIGAISPKITHKLEPYP